MKKKIGEAKRGALVAERRKTEREKKKNYREIAILRRSNAILKKACSILKCREKVRDEKLRFEKGRERKTMKALAESEARFRMLFENNPVAYQSLNGRGEYLDVNVPLCLMLGYSRSELLGRKFGEFWAGDARKNFFKKFQALKKRGRVDNEELNLMTRKGEILTVLLTARIQLDPMTGKFIRTHCILHDITSRKKMEKETSETLRFLETLIDTIPYPVFYKDRRGIYRGCNRDFSRYMGMEKEQIIGKTVYELTPAEIAEKYEEMDEELFRNHNHKQTYEWMTVGKSGEKRNVVFDKAVYLDASGSPAGIVGVITDVTEHKRFERELRKTLEELRDLEDIVNRSPAVAFLWQASPGWPVEFVSDNVRQFDYDPKDLISGRVPYSNIIHPDDLERIGAEVAKFSTGEISRFDQVYRIMTGKGDVRWVDDRTWIRRNPEGKITHYQGILIDITEKKHAAEQLVAAHKRLEEIVEFLPDATFIVDRENKIIVWNKAMEEMTGVAKKDMIGKDHSYSSVPFYGRPTKFLLDMLDESDSEILARYQSVKKTGKSIYAEVFTPALYGNKGAYVWAATTLLFDEMGKKTGAIESIRDITDLKNVESALKEREEVNRKLLATIPDIVVRTDLQGTVLFVNESALQNYGYEKSEDFVGRNLMEFIVPEDHELALKNMAAMMNGPLGPKEYRMSLGAGFKRKESFPIEVNGDVFRDDKGRPFGLVFLCRDISDRKLNEEKLRESVSELRMTLRAAINALASAIEMRDPYTAGHQERVTRLATAIAGALKMPKERIDAVEIAGSVHDIGKLGIPAEILSKPTELSEVERSLVRTHATTGFTILNKITFPWPIAEIVHQHHERIDGSGYPNGLKGEDILTEAKILAVADTVEAMSSHRPYRPSLGIEKALMAIKDGKGKLFDAGIVDVCLELFASGKFAWEDTPAD
jgi:PAS domain S-box-containing protein